MVTAVNRLGVDAAIIFSDADHRTHGLHLGPRKVTVSDHNPLREPKDVDRVQN